MNFDIDITVVCLACNNKGIREVVFNDDPSMPLKVKKMKCPDCKGESPDYNRSGFISTPEVIYL